MILQTILFLVLALLTYMVVKQYIDGRQLANGRSFSIKTHKSKARRILCLIVISVVAIEGMVRWKGGAASYDALLISHITAAIFFTIGIVLMNWKFNGTSSKRLHRIMAYASIPPFLTMFFTAIPIILRL